MLCVMNMTLKKGKLTNEKTSVDYYVIDMFDDLVVSKHSLCN